MPRAGPAPADAVAAPGAQVVRIPLRLPPDEPPPFRPEDVVLQTGDIVFIEARDTEVFYTGGLLPRASSSCRATTTSTWSRPSRWPAARSSTAAQHAEQPVRYHHRQRHRLPVAQPA